MDLQVVSEGQGRFILQCPEELEWSARVDLVEQITAQARPNEVRGIILDLAEVTYINSAGIGAIFSLRKFALDNEAVLVVARPRPAIQRMLKTVNLPDLIPMVDSMAEAREKIDAQDSGSSDA
ncbi:MAG: STAS domain-containing protein [Phycisphaerae bacterium]